MPRTYIPSMLCAAMLLAVFSTPGLSAQTASNDAADAEWERGWNAAQAEATFSPSKLARAMVQKETESQEGETVEGRAERAFASALQAEMALRLGYTYQEIRAQLRQTRRLEASSGEENGKRMAAKLANTERKNAARGAGKRIGGQKGPEKTPEKGKSGR